MANDIDIITGHLSQWLDGMEQFTLPEWEQLPQLELYMDQVILLLKQYLAPLHHGEEDKAITTSIINNYVRMKVIPPPVKKKYSRVHIASLIMICALKQSLSISCIQQMLAGAQNEESMCRLYDDFVGQYCTVRDSFTHQARNTDHPLLAQDTGKLLTSCAVISTLSTELTEFLLRQPPDEKNKK